MKRAPLRRNTSLGPGPVSIARGSTFPPPTSKPRARRATFTPASKAQRGKVYLAPCIIEGCPAQPCDPMHVIDRVMLSEGQEDPRAVVAACRPHHRLYDDGLLDLLPHLERNGRRELAFAVERFGLISTLRRVTNTREDQDAQAVIG